MARRRIIIARLATGFTTDTMTACGSFFDASVLPADNVPTPELERTVLSVDRIWSDKFRPDQGRGRLPAKADAVMAFWIMVNYHVAAFDRQLVALVALHEKAVSIMDARDETKASTRCSITPCFADAPREKWDGDTVCDVCGM